MTTPSTHRRDAYLVSYGTRWLALYFATWAFVLSTEDTATAQTRGAGSNYEYDQRGNEPNGSAMSNAGWTENGFFDFESFFLIPNSVELTVQLVEGFLGDGSFEWGPNSIIAILIGLFHEPIPNGGGG